MAGPSTDWGVGNRTRHWLKVETTDNTHSDFAATDAILPLERPKIGPRPKPNVVREDTQGSLGHSSTRTQRQGAIPVPIKTYMRPYGEAGTPPDIHPAIYAVFLAYVNTASTSDNYKSNNNVQPVTLQYGQVELAPYAGTSTDTAYQGWEVGGLAADKYNMDVDGVSPPTETISLQGKSFRYFKTTTLNGALSGSESEIVVTNNTGDYFEGNSVWTIGFFNPTTGAVVNDNSGSGYSLTGKSGSGNTTWAVSPNIGGAVADGSQVMLLVPGETVAGNPLAEGGHSFTYDGAALAIKSFALELDLNLEIKNDDATETGPHDMIRKGKRTASVTVGFHRQNDRQRILADAYQTGAAAAMVLTLGGVVTVNLDNPVPDGNPDEGLQDEGQAMPNLKFLLLETSAGAGDEIEITYTG